MATVYISISDTTVGLIDHPKTVDFIKVYPNPATEYLIFEGSTMKPFNLLITDIYGNVIKQDYLTGKFIMNTEGVKPGIYFYNASDGTNTVNGKFVIMN